MSGIAPGLVVFISIVAAAAIVALCAAVWKTYSGRIIQTTDPEEGMLASIGPQQASYMRDVRMRGQIQAWGVAPAFEEEYQPPRSQVGRSASMGGMTWTSYG